MAGAWQGLRLQHSRADLARAVVEGACYAVRFVIELTLAQAETPGNELRCVGGGARNPFWQQLKANITGLPVDVPQVNDVSAQGAALLAGLAVGAFSDESSASRLAYRTEVRYEPQAEQLATYEKGYQKFLDLKSRNL
jgi:sugar (pentulose or hexulose) kinase